LRKYGVRFGAFHIYLPQLLKPAPRTLALQLYALKHEGSESAGLEAAQQLASSGRTSIAADNAIARGLYRVVGYRLCGNRAVRVDILERLADQIRPALAWREGAPGPKPPGAIDGFGFTVSVGMTSLAGCSGEDFASILRSLGYRMEKRPKPPEPPPAASAGAEAAPGAIEPVAAETVADAPSAAVEALPESEAIPIQSAPEPAPDVTAAPAAPAEAAREPVDAPAIPDVVAEAPVAPVADAELLVIPASEPVPEVDAQVSAVTPATADAAAPAIDEQQFIEVWRPGRSPEERREAKERRQARARRPRRDRRPDAQPQPQAAAAPAGDATAAPAAATPETPAPDGEQDKGHRRRHRPERFGKERRDEGERPQRRDGPPRGERPDRGGRADRGQRKERGDRPFRRDRRDRDRDDAPPRIFRDHAESRRGKEPDPNSPFAKLAALKEQLESDAKERR
jgi:ATP-dependent RNA helicase SUPV3L1/SUV3